MYQAQHNSKDPLTAYYLELAAPVVFGPQWVKELPCVQSKLAGAENAEAHAQAQAQEAEAQAKLEAQVRPTTPNVLAPR